MATFGQFMRTTMHNFRMFWSASFGATGQPLKIVTEEMMADAMGEEKTTIDANDWLEIEELADAQSESPATDSTLAVDGREIDASDPGAQSTVAPITVADRDQPIDVGAEEPDEPALQLEADGQGAEDADQSDSPADEDFADELDADLGDEPSNEPTSELIDDVDDVDDVDDAGKLGAESNLEPELDVDAEDAELEDIEPEDAEPEDIESGEESPAPESELVVQGELELEDTEGELPPDIQVESHGKRLGLTTLLESLLFVSDEPVEASQLARVLNISGKRVEAGLTRLDRLYTSTARGLRVQVLDGRYQLVTAPETANAIEDFLNLDLTTKLSGPALEALAVIAYRQPVTRSQVEAVRGVDCAGVLRSLTQRGLVEEAGRLDTVGRPILYGVTDLFMQHFGLIKLGELPPLQVDDEDMLWAATKLAEMEQNAEE